MPCGMKMLTDTSLPVICGMCVWEEEDDEQLIGGKVKNANNFWKIWKRIA